MKKILAIQILTILLLVNPIITLAQNIPASNVPNLKLTPSRTAVQNRILKTEEKVASREANMEQRVMERKETMELRRENIASKQAVIKEKVEERIELRKEKVASREAAFKQKIEQFKDKKKAELASKINENINLINQRRTEQMMMNLAKMSEVLEKLEGKVAEGLANGQNVSDAQTAISTSKTLIDDAKNAVNTQSQQDYTIVVSTELKIKQDATTIRTKLQTDLKAAQDKIVIARQSAANAVSISVSLLGGQNGAK